MASGCPVVQSAACSAKVCLNAGAITGSAHGNQGREESDGSFLSIKADLFPSNSSRPCFPISFLRRLLAEWVVHYNQGRPHTSLGPGIPDASNVLPVAGPSSHEISHDHRVIAKSILGGLHHEYRLEKIAA